MASDNFLRFYHSVGQSAYRSKNETIREGLKEGMKFLRLKFMEEKRNG